ncbi:ectoine synthase [Mesorhizobium opportunistum]
MVYALDKHDRHILRADADKPMIMACVFNPPSRATRFTRKTDPTH